MDERTRELLIGYADQYETQDFLNGDPSWFMHQVVGVPDQEVMALLASCLSYGSRSQFFPKIQFMLDESHGKVYDWVRQGAYKEAIPDTDACYYRLYTCHQVRCFRLHRQAEPPDPHGHPCPANGAAVATDSSAHSYMGISHSVDGRAPAGLSR